MRDVEDNAQAVAFGDDLSSCQGKSGVLLAVGDDPVALREIVRQPGESSDPEPGFVKLAQDLNASAKPRGALHREEGRVLSGGEGGFYVGVAFHKSEILTLCGRGLYSLFSSKENYNRIKGCCQGKNAKLGLSG